MISTYLRPKRRAVDFNLAAPLRKIGKNQQTMMCNHSLTAITRQKKKETVRALKRRHTITV